MIAIVSASASSSAGRGDWLLINDYGQLGAFPSYQGAMKPICEGLREVGTTVTHDSCFGIKVDDKSCSHFVSDHIFNFP